MLMLLLLCSQMTHEHALVLSNETETVQMLRCSYALVFLLWLCSNFNSNERYYAILCLCPHITNNMTIIIIKTLLLLLISYVCVTLSFSCSCHVWHFHSYVWHFHVQLQLQYFMWMCFASERSEGKYHYAPSNKNWKKQKKWTFSFHVHVWHFHVQHFMCDTFMFMFMLMFFCF